MAALTRNVCILQFCDLQHHKLSAASATGSVAQSLSGRHPADEACKCLQHGLQDSVQQ